MSFLDEATYNVTKGSAPPDPDTLEDDDVVNIEEKSPKNLGYGKDPETGKFKSMSSNDAIKHFLAQVKQGVEDEGDEWPTLKEDLAKFIRKAGGAEYKTPFTDFAKDLKDFARGNKDLDGDGDVDNDDDLDEFAKKLSDIEKMPEDKFQKFIKNLYKRGYDKIKIQKMEKAYKEAQKDIVKEETITGEYEGKPVKFKIKDITNLKDILDVSKSAKDFVNKISMAVTDETSSLSKEDAKKLILFYKKRTIKEAEDINLDIEDDIVYLSGDSGEYEGEIEDGKVDFSVVYDDETEFDDSTWKSILGPKHAFVKISKKIPTKVEAAGDYVMITVDLEDLKKYLSEGKLLKEAEDIKLPSDTTFTVDLKHLVKKHMNKGNDKESAIKFTKALMKKLHNKGEVNVDGTKVIFKEMKMDQDTPLALPAAETPNFLGDDGMDYEGGMAKSQMLKMKKYVDALSNMIEDESQLESWVQAKLTKASDYMSAVYHYLDYQNSKMNELNEDEGQNIADFLNANYKEIASKLGNPGSNFEIIGDNKVATAGDGNKGIDISFDKNHMDKLFPEDDPYNEVKELTIAGKVVYYNDYRGN